MLFKYIITCFSKKKKKDIITLLNFNFKSFQKTIFNFKKETHMTSIDKDLIR